MIVENHAIASHLVLKTLRQENKTNAMSTGVGMVPFSCHIDFLRRENCDHFHVGLFDGVSSGQQHFEVGSVLCMAQLQFFRE